MATSRSVSDLNSDVIGETISQPELNCGDGFTACTVPVNLDHGFGPLRCVSAFAEECQDYDGCILLAREDQADRKVDAKNILACLSLGAFSETHIEILVSGEDESAQRQALRLASALMGSNSYQLDFKAFG